MKLRFPAHCVDKRGFVLLAVWTTISACALPSAAQQPDYVFPDGVEVHLLDEAAGRAAIADDSAEPYFSKLTLLELAIKLRRPLESDDLEREQAAFREFVQSCVRPWSQEEKEKLITALKGAHEKFTKTAPAVLPKRWRFIKTDGREDLGSHTRGDCIILHGQYLGIPKLLEPIVIHETVHVFSRANPEVRNKLYEAIGFRHLACMDVPAELDRRRITNPDCTDVGYAISITGAEGKPIDAVMFLYSKHAEFRKDVKMPFAYVRFALFEVQQSDACWHLITRDDAELGGISPRKAEGFFDQVGWNTQYLIHPEEIIADNVALLVRSRGGDSTATVVTHAVLERIETILNPPSTEAPISPD